MFISGKDNWRDLVHQKAKDDIHLQGLLFKYLTEGRVTEIDIPEAIYWSRQFVTIPRLELPYLVTQELERIESSDRSLSNLQVEEDWDAEEASLPAQRLADSNVAAESFPADENYWFSAQEANSDEYLELDIPFEKIEIVDTKSMFQNFMQEIRLEVSPALFFNWPLKFSLLKIRINRD